MGKVFGFDDDELKLLLVSVRQMRRTFAAALKASPGEDLHNYAALYDKLYEKLLDMAGPLPEGVGELF
jgi:hypothetical protein